MSRTSTGLGAALHRLLGAAVGVVAIHQAAYLLAHPSTVGRAVVSEGHAYLTPVATIVVPLAGAMLLWAAVCRLTALTPAGLRSGPPRAGDYAALFVVQELVERLADGQPATAVLSEPALWMGLGLVPLFALAGRALARSLERLDGAATSAVVVAPAPQFGSVRPEGPSLPVFALSPAVHRVRGPPSSLR